MEWKIAEEALPYGRATAPKPLSGAGCGCATNFNCRPRKHEKLKRRKADQLKTGKDDKVRPRKEAEACRTLAANNAAKSNQSGDDVSPHERLWSAVTCHRFSVRLRLGAAVGGDSSVISAATGRRRIESGDRSPHSKSRPVPRDSYETVSSWAVGRSRLSSREVRRGSSCSAVTCHRFGPRLRPVAAVGGDSLVISAATGRRRIESGDRSPHSKSRPAPRDSYETVSSWAVGRSRLSSREVKRGSSCSASRRGSTRTKVKPTACSFSASASQSNA